MSGTQTLANLYVSVEIYNQGIQRYAGYPAEKSDPQIRRQLDRLTAEIGSLLDGYPGQRDPQEAAVVEAILQLFKRHRELYESLLTAGGTPRSDAQELMSGQILTMCAQRLEWPAASRCR